MFMNLVSNSNSTPAIQKHTIKLADYAYPAQFLEFARSNNLGSYIYSFKYKDQVMKIGMSMNKGNNGERAYRQLAHCKGWNRQFRSGCGADMLITIRDFEEAMGVSVRRQNITLDILDLGRDLDKIQIEKIEAMMILDHEKQHGYKPIGNYKDYSVAMRKTFVPDKHCNALFNLALHITTILRPSWSRAIGGSVM